MSLPFYIPYNINFINFLVSSNKSENIHMNDSIYCIQDKSLKFIASRIKCLSCIQIQKQMVQSRSQYKIAFVTFNCLKIENELHII